MNSQWFQPRQSLLIAREHFVGKDCRKRRNWKRSPSMSIRWPPTPWVKLSPTLIAPSRARNSPTGAERQLDAFRSGWAQARGTLSATAGVRDGGANPSLTTEITHGNRKQLAGPVKLPRGWDWNCKSTRSIELGEFEIAPGTNQLLLTHAGDVGVDVFSLRLVRPPESEASDQRRVFLPGFHRLCQPRSASKPG